MDSLIVSNIFDDDGSKYGNEKYMAGVAGIEPANDGIKTRCLTTWLHPKKKTEIYYKNILCHSNLELFKKYCSVLFQ